MYIHSSLTNEVSANKRDKKSEVNRLKAYNNRFMKLLATVNNQY